MIQSLPYYKRVRLVLRISNTSNKYVVLYESEKPNFERVFSKDDNTFLCYSVGEVGARMRTGIERHDMSIFRLMLNGENEVVFDQNNTLQKVKRYTYQLFIWAAKSVSPYNYLQSLAKIKEIRPFFSDKSDFKSYYNHEVEASLFRILLFNIQQHLAAKKVFVLERYFTDLDGLYTQFIAHIDSIDLAKINHSNPNHIKNTLDLIVFEAKSNYFNAERLQEILLRSQGRGGNYFSMLKHGKVFVFLKFFDVTSFSLFDQISIPVPLQGKVGFTLSQEASYSMPLFLDSATLLEIYGQIATVFKHPVTQLEAYKTCIANYLLCGVLSGGLMEETTIFLQAHWAGFKMPRLDKFVQDRSQKINAVAFIYFKPFYEDFFKNQISDSQREALDDIVKRLHAALQKDMQQFYSLIETTLTMLGIDEAGFAEILFFAIKTSLQHEKT